MLVLSSSNLLEALQSILSIKLFCEVFDDSTLELEFTEAFRLLHQSSCFVRFLDSSTIEFEFIRIITVITSMKLFCEVF